MQRKAEGWGGTVKEGWGIQREGYLIDAWGGFISTESI
jgi:hypothetical protein